MFVHLENTTKSDFYDRHKIPGATAKNKHAKLGISQGHLAPDSVKSLRERYEAEIDNLQTGFNYSSLFGINPDPSPDADEFVVPGKDIEWGNGSVFKVLFTPGHSAGHVSFFHEEQKFLFSGDVLFRNSIGRTDLPGGSMDTLMKTIKEVLLPLGDDVRVFPGHMEETTLGFERQYNQFILHHA